MSAGECVNCGHSLHDHRRTGACLAIVSMVTIGVGPTKEVCRCNDYHEDRG